MPLFKISVAVGKSHPVLLEGTVFYMGDVDVACTAMKQELASVGKYVMLGTIVAIREEVVGFSIER